MLGAMLLASESYASGVWKLCFWSLKAMLKQFLVYRAAELRVKCCARVKTPKARVKCCARVSGVGLKASKSQENLAENLPILMFEWFFNQFLNDFEEHRDDFFLNVTRISQISQIRRQGRGSSFLFLVSRVACKQGQQRPLTSNSTLSNWL